MFQKGTMSEKAVRNIHNIKKFFNAEVVGWIIRNF
jgi:hypothetical protein